MRDWGLLGESCKLEQSEPEPEHGGEKWGVINRDLDFRGLFFQLMRALFGGFGVLGGILCGVGVSLIVAAGVHDKRVFSRFASM